MTARRSGVLAGAVAAVLLVAGCGSDAPASAPDDQIVSTTTAATTIEPGTTATTGSTEPAPSDTAAATTATSLPATPLRDVAVEFAPYGTFDQPIALETRPGHPELLYLAERPGRVRALGAGIDEVVLDISDSTVAEGERGLLGMTFSPEGDYLYLSYTDDSGTTTIDEYGIVDDGTVDTNSKRRVLTQEQPYSNHNGGHITFGPDGYLYLGLGDGGAADDPDRNGLALGTLLGKLIRIDPSRPENGLAYGIPADNPFVGVEGARPEIWSYGLRNPWRFSFDPANGDLWIGDVGQNEWEEVSFAAAADGAGKGTNFGWSAWEGTHRFNDDQDEAGHVPPVVEYPHGADGCSITGGLVYRGTAIPGLSGAYLYGDYCSGNVWAARIGGDAEVVALGTIDALVSFGEDANGELYALSLNGDVVQLTPA